EVARDLLVRAPGLQRVRPRQVDDLDPAPLVREHALRARDRLPRPVPRVLPEPRQRVEDRALPGVRVPRQRDQEVPAALRVQTQPHELTPARPALGMATRRTRPQHLTRLPSTPRRRPLPGPRPSPTW